MSPICTIVAYENCAFKKEEANYYKHNWKNSRHKIAPERVQSLSTIRIAPFYFKRSFEILRCHHTTYATKSQNITRFPSPPEASVISISEIFMHCTAFGQGGEKNSYVLYCTSLKHAPLENKSYEISPIIINRNLFY